MAKYIKGLNKDTGYVDQPTGTWRHAKNAVVNRQAGGISNEKGIEFELALSLATNVNVPGNIEDINERVIGKIEVSDGRVIIFTTTVNSIVWPPENGENDNYPWGANEYSCIYEYKSNGQLTPILWTWPATYTALAENNNVDFNLKFDSQFQIKGEYKIDSEGNLNIYWTDDLNPPRALNVTRQLATGNPARIYNVDPWQSPNKNYIDRLNLFPHSGPIPHINPNKEVDGITYPRIGSGGGLYSGAYQLSLAYVDEDLVTTNYLTVSNPVSIVSAMEGVRPIERYDGDPSGTQTGKSITWIVDNVNTDYEYLRPVVIQTVGGVEKAFKLKDITIGQSNDIYITFTGLEGYESAAVEEVIIDAVSYDTAKSITQLDNILYLGNLTGTLDIGFQRYANNIKLTARTKRITNFDPFELSDDNLRYGYASTVPFEGLLESQNLPGQEYYSIENGYRSSRWNVNHKGYQRGEVYAIYIAFIMNDGSMSYAYHIPGREELGVDSLSFIEYNDGNPPWELTGWLNQMPDCNMQINNLLGFSGLDMDTAQGGNIWPGDDQLYGMTSGTGQRFQFYEYSYDDWDPLNRHMNYWQNANEFYPTTANYDIWDAEDGNQGSIRNRPVRHHHFPSNENPDFKVISDEESGLYPSTAATTSYTTRYLRSASFRGLHKLGPSKFAIGAGPWDAVVSTEGLVVPSGIDMDVIDMNPNGDYDIPSSGCIYCQIDNGYGDLNWESDSLWGVGCNGWLMGRITDIEMIPGDYYGAVPMGSYLQVGSPGFGSDFFALSLGNNDWGNRRGIMVDTLPEDDALTGYISNTCSCKKMHTSLYPTGSGMEMNDLTESLEDLNIDGNLCSSMSPDPTVWDYNMYNQHPDYAPCCGGGLENQSYDNNPFNDDLYQIANSMNISSDTSLYSPKDSISTGRCYWVEEVETTIGTDNENGYISNDVDVLGFDLSDVKIPPEIAEKVQGFRIYYAKREHHNRRVLGQNPIIPMESRRHRVGMCAEQVGINWAEEYDWLEITDFGDYAQGKADIEWDAYPWIRETAWYPHRSEDEDDMVAQNRTTHMCGNWDNSSFSGDGDFCRMCNYTAMTFHDFYLLNGHHSLAHASHVKIEYFIQTLAYQGSIDDLSWVTRYAIDPETGITSIAAIMRSQLNNEDNYEDNCYSKYVNNAFFFGWRYWAPTGILPQPFYDCNNLYNDTNNEWNKTNCMTGGVLNRPIKENAKNYLRGNSFFEASPLGFAFPINNDGGESSIALQLVQPRGLPLLPVHKQVVEQTIVTSNKEQSAMGGLPQAEDYPLISEKKSALWQVSLQAYKQDMYNNIDTNELVWTGYEVVGKDFQNHFVVDDTSKTFNTNSVYPDGIFGGDTFICRHAWRSTANFKTDSNSRGGKRMTDLRAAYMTITESTDNINFRHQGEKASGADYYSPNTPIQELLNVDNGIDLTWNAGDNTTGNIRYNEDYSKVNTLRTAIPLPVAEDQLTNFPTRVQRSVKDSGSSLVDSYRMFLANEFKDLPKNRGELWSLVSYNNLLYFHMEDTLFKAQGKESLELKDGSEAFVGSGDLFAKDPEEVYQTYYGYGGTKSLWSGIVTRHGYFFVDQLAKKVFMLADKLMDLSAVGLKEWFKKNIPFELEEYGLDPGTTRYHLDNPLNMGFHSTWDPETNRILLTKREIKPTRLFQWLQLSLLEASGFGGSMFPGAIQYNEDVFQQMVFNPDATNLNEVFVWQEIDLIAGQTSIPGSGIPNPIFPGGLNIVLLPLTWGQCQSLIWEQEVSNPDNMWINNTLQTGAAGGNCIGIIEGGGQIFEEEIGGWTISFYPELAIWVSFHDYTPSVYMLSGESLLSAGTTSDLYKHNTNQFGFFYDRRHQFEFEAIHAENSTETKVFSSINYHCDVWSLNEVADFVSATTQHVKLHEGGFTSFYTFTSLQNSGETDLEYMVNTRKTGGNDWKINRFRDMARLVDSANGYYVTGDPTPAGTIIQSVETTSDIEPMFIFDGMNKTINPQFLDLAKSTDKQRKFIDKWLGICLKYDNISNNLLTLYSTDVELRKYFR